MTITLTINSTDNAAFEEDWRTEAARIMKHAAKRLQEGLDGGAVMDINGNKVGEFEVTGE